MNRKIRRPNLGEKPKLFLLPGLESQPNTTQQELLTQTANRLFEQIFYQLMQTYANQVETRKLRSQTYSKTITLKNLTIYRADFNLHLEEISQISFPTPKERQPQENTDCYISFEQGDLWSSYQLRQNGVLTKFNRGQSQKYNQPSGQPVRVDEINRFGQLLAADKLL